MRIKKPSVVRRVEKEVEKVAERGKRAVKGHVRITVHNGSPDDITVTASIGNETVEITPGKSGAIRKANIGDSVEVYVNGGRSSKQVWKSGVLIQNRIELEYNGRDLKRS